MQSQLTPRKGPERMGNSPPWTRDCILSKDVFPFFVSFLKKMNPLVIVCVRKIKKISLYMLKINHAMGLEHAFVLGTLVLMVVNS